MWIVRLALNRPYTFIVFALVIILISPLVITRTPTDIFPEINIPVVSIVWNYSGLSPTDMEQRIVSGYERSLTTTVDNIQHVESQTEEGRSIIKGVFPVRSGNWQGDCPNHGDFANCDSLNASGDDSSTGDYLFGLDGANPSAWTSRRRAFRAGIERLGREFRTQPAWPQFPAQRLPIHTVESSGRSAVNVDIPALQAKGLSPVDVINAVSLQNLILPSGSVKLGPSNIPWK